ncbi:MAG: ATPase domain-containing protein [bacterium]
MKNQQKVSFLPLANILSEELSFGTNWLVRGDQGAGKTTFAFQFLSQGLRKRESALFVAADEPVDRVRSNLTNLGFGTLAYERSKKIVFIDACSIDSKEEYFVTDLSDPEELIYTLNQAILKLEKPVRVVIDSLSSLAVHYLPQDFVSMVHEKNRRMRTEGIVLMDLYLAHTLESKERYSLTNAYDLSVDLYLAEEKGGVPKKYLRLLKVRGCSYDPRPFPYTVIAKQGIVVNKAYYQE